MRTVLAVPYRPGEYNKGCTLAAGEMVLGYLGKPIGQLQFSCLNGFDEIHGASLSLIKEIAEIDGFKANLRDDMTLDDLKDNIDDDYPVIVAQRFGFPPETSANNMHARVVVGYDGHNIIVHDPCARLGPNLVLPNKTFEDFWISSGNPGYKNSGLTIRE